MFRKYLIAVFTLFALLLSACTSSQTRQPTQALPVTGNSSTLAIFETQLSQALVNRDYPKLKGLMSNSFGVATWKGSQQVLSSDAAIQQIQSQLTAHSNLSFDGQADLKSLLKVDPLTVFGPQRTAMGAVLVNGWGPQGKDQALLLIGQNQVGVYQWQDLLIAPGGFNAQ